MFVNSVEFIIDSFIIFLHFVMFAFFICHTKWLLRLVKRLLELDAFVAALQWQLEEVVE